MTFFSDLIEVLKQYGPTLAVLIIAYFRDQAVEARNNQRVAELEKKFMENKANVEKENAGLSSDAVIDKLTGAKPGA